MTNQPPTTEPDIVWPPAPDFVEPAPTVPMSSPGIIRRAKLLSACDSVGVAIAQLLFMVIARKSLLTMSRHDAILTTTVAGVAFAITLGLLAGRRLRTISVTTVEFLSIVFIDVLIIQSISRLVALFSIMSTHYPGLLELYWKSVIALPNLAAIGAFVALSLVSALIVRAKFGQLQDMRRHG